MVQLSVYACTPNMYIPRTFLAWFEHVVDVHWRRYSMRRLNERDAQCCVVNTLGATSRSSNGNCRFTAPHPCRGYSVWQVTFLMMYRQHWRSFVSGVMIVCIQFFFGRPSGSHVVWFSLKPPRAGSYAFELYGTLWFAVVQGLQPRWLF